MDRPQLNAADYKSIIKIIIIKKSELNFTLEMKNQETEHQTEVFSMVVNLQHI